MALVDSDVTVLRRILEVASGLYDEIVSAMSGHTSGAKSRFRLERLSEPYEIINRGDDNILHVLVKGPRGKMGIHTTMNSIRSGAILSPREH